MTPSAEWDADLRSAALDGNSSAMHVHDTPVTRESAVELAARRLIDANSAGTPCSPVRDLIGADDIRLAYAVQEKVNSARIAGGATVVGRKVGATSQAVRDQLGVDQPDLGVLFDDMVFIAEEQVPIGALIQPKVEAEVGFVLAEDLVEGDLDLGQVAAAVDYAVAAIEICDSRISEWDISFGDTVADNASAGAYVLGSERKTLSEFAPRDAQMRMTVTGEADSTGTGAACLGDPLVALQWLARTARELGDPLRAGQVVLSGALGPMRPASPGAEVVVTITGLGSVSITFAPEEKK